MDDSFLPLPGVQHPDIAQGTGVCRLAAAFRIEGRGIQKDFKSLCRFPAGQHPGGEGAHMGIFVV